MPEKRKSSSHSPTASAAAAGLAASYNAALQLVFRLATFALNAWLLRRVTPATLGVANVRLALLHSTILFLSRESFRKVCLGARPDRVDPARRC